MQKDESLTSKVYRCFWVIFYCLFKISGVVSSCPNCNNPTDKISEKSEKCMEHIVFILTSECSTLGGNCKTNSKWIPEQIQDYLKFQYIPYLYIDKYCEFDCIFCISVILWTRDIYQYYRFFLMELLLYSLFFWSKIILRKLLQCF